MYIICMYHVHYMYILCMMINKSMKTISAKRALWCPGQTLALILLLWNRGVYEYNVKSEQIPSNGAAIGWIWLTPAEPLWTTSQPVQCTPRLEQHSHLHTLTFCIGTVDSNTRTHRESFLFSCLAFASLAISFLNVRFRKRKDDSYSRHVLCFNLTQTRLSPADECDFLDIWTKFNFINLYNLYEINSVANDTTLQPF